MRNNLVTLLLLSAVKAEKSDFKNQQEFEKARKDLNEAEGKNKEVFDSINQKLQDSEYVMMASQNAVVMQVETEAKVNVALTAEEKAIVAASPMSNEEAQCYLNRYPDVV